MVALRVGFRLCPGVCHRRGAGPAGSAHRQLCVSGWRPSTRGAVKAAARRFWTHRQAAASARAMLCCSSACAFLATAPVFALAV